MRVFPDKTVDGEFKELGDLGFSGSLNDRQFKYLLSTGLTGSLTDMHGASGFNLFGFTYPATEPGNFPGTLFTEDQAAGEDTSVWTLPGDPAITLTGSGAASDGTQTASTGVWMTSGETAANGDLIGLVAKVLTTNANAGLLLGTPSGSQTALGASLVNLTGWQTQNVFIDSDRPVQAYYRWNPGRYGSIDALNAVNITELLKQKWFIVGCIGQSNWVGNSTNQKTNPALDLPVYGAVTVPSGHNATFGSTLDANGHGVPMVPVEPIQHLTTHSKHGPSAEFLRELRKHIPEDYTLVYAATAMASAGFVSSHWQEGNQAEVNFFDQMDHLLQEAPEGSVVGGIVFCQGENDRGQVEGWTAGATGILDKCNARWGDVPVVFSEIGKEYSDSSAVEIMDRQKEFATGSGSIHERPLCAYVPRPDGSVLVDGTHFDAATHRIRGVEVAQALRDLIYP